MRAAGVATVRNPFGWQLDVVRRWDGTKGIAVLPHQRVVERTFGWLGHYRRLVRENEHTVSSGEATTYLASTRHMFKFTAM